MYIKSIVIDGFKSYGQRVEIKDFDREFNAITGLNGTGKSNILDSICFVLGIKMKDVRANSLQELIYKNGQAGVTSASVTITFDNKDKSQSPVGYESDETITISRQISIPENSRYIINGSPVQTKRIQDLFASVHLNVANPHFLIMQGRITKVLNMKSYEILAMLEEAAGTGLYESKKVSAEKMISKKETKLQNLNTLVREEIVPKIEKLKGEKEKYLELQKVSREVEHWGKIHKACTFWKFTQKVLEIQQLIESKTVELNESKVAKKEKENDVLAIDAEVVNIEQSMTEESSGNLAETTKKLQDEKQAAAEITGKIKSDLSSITAEERTLKLTLKSVQEDKDALKKKEKDFAAMDKKYEQIRLQNEEDKKSYAMAIQKLNAISTGQFAAEDGTVGTLQDQLISMREAMVNAETQLKHDEMNLAHVKSQIPQKKKELEKLDKEAKTDKSLLETKERELHKCNEALKKIESSYKVGTFEQMEATMTQLTDMQRQKKAELDRKIYECPRSVNFDYTDPEPGFDRSRVKGRVCKLIKVKDDTFTYAIETMLGGTLQSVITDTAETSKLLISKGNLKNRTNFLPLDRITCRPIGAERFQKAVRKVGKENVFQPLDLVEYDPKYHEAMLFCLSNFLIIRDGRAHGAALAFDKEISAKCISLDGTVYDPQGTMSGGAVAKGSGILTFSSQISKIEAELEKVEKDISSLKPKMDMVHAQYQRWYKQHNERNLLQRDFDLMKGRIEKTSQFMLQKEYDELVRSQTELQENIKQNKVLAEDYKRKIAEKEHDMNNLDGLKQRELKSAEAEVKKFKEKSEKSAASWMHKERDYDAQMVEIEKLKQDIEKGEENYEQKKTELDKMKEEVKKLQDQASSSEERIRILEAEIQAQRDTLNAKNHELQKLKKNRDKITAEIKRLGIVIGDIEHELQKIAGELEENQQAATEMEEDHPWIASEKEHFGSTDGPYDFKRMNPVEISRKYQKLREQKEKLERTVDKKAMNSLKHEENEYKNCKLKMKIVEQDRAKLLQTIAELDEQKKITLEKAWQTVNKDFGSIFSTVLPDAYCKLQPPEGKTLLEGLEIKVAFGGLWKNSLGELSGGQRSLVALSLILAMLRFKPAPLYILDEVDAALDLSHTQNIGQMLKAHFKSSQFIMVSLKEGMFSNANVIYRTKFVDGYSSVTRTVNRSR